MIQPENDVKSAPKTIMVVEDDVNLRFVVSEFLRNSGYIVVEASNADEAFAFLTAPNDVSLVFTDVHMPGEMNGLTLARLVAETLPHLGLVVTSGELPKQDAPAGLTFTRKPYDLLQLLAQFRALLQDPPA